MNRPWTYSALPLRPHSRWPNGARIALWVAVGIESYRPDQGHTEDIMPRGPAPDLVNAAWRDYGNRVGAFRLFDRLSNCGIRPTVLLNTDVYDEAPDVLRAARAARAEIVAHGQSNSDSLSDMTQEEAGSYIQACRERILIEEGRAPGGWSSPWLSHRPDTLSQLKQTGFEYVLDFRLDDQPIWLTTDAGPILSIPYAAELNDSTTMVGRYCDANAFAQMILDEYTALMEGSEDHALVMSVVLHSFISGQPFRLQPVAHALEHIAAQGNAAQGNKVWLTTPAEIFEAVPLPASC